MRIAWIAVSNESDVVKLNYHLVSRTIKQRYRASLEEGGSFYNPLMTGSCSWFPNATEALEAAHITPVAHNGSMAILKEFQ